MTFQQLQYLLEVCRTGSVSRAAENLYISRSSVSASISSLESELGYPIFIRTLQGLTLSPQGKLALEYAERICQTHRLMTDLNTGARLVTIAISDYLPVVLASVSLAEAYKNRQDLRFSFPVLPYNEIIEKLSVNEVDAAVFCRLGNIQLSIEALLEKHGLSWKVIGQVPTVIIIGKNHPLGQKEDLQLRDLDNRVFIDMLRHDISKNGFLRSAVKIDTNKTITTNTSAVRYRLIQRGLGYTVGRKPNRDTIERYQLRCIPIPELSQPLFAVTNPNRPVSEEVQRFFEFLEDEIKDPSAACSDL